MMRDGGQLLVESLVALGATKAFGVPGESYLAVLDALHDTQGKLDFVLCRNEGGAAFMASAWGKLTGRPGICMVTRGPGVTNASIGIHTAMQDSAPMLCFVGQVGIDMKGREAFQEIDYRAVFGTMAKWVVEIDDVNRIPEILARAWMTATTGRPGPVVIALPEDMLASLTDAAPLTGPRVGFTLAFGLSDNAVKPVDNRLAGHLGHVPQDNTEAFRAAVEAQHPVPDPKAPAVRHLGGGFVDLGHPDDGGAK